LLKNRQTISTEPTHFRDESKLGVPHKGGEKRKEVLALPKKASRDLPAIHSLTHDAAKKKMESLLVLERDSGRKLGGKGGNPLDQRTYVGEKKTFLSWRERTKLPRGRHFLYVESFHSIS